MQTRKIGKVCGPMMANEKDRLAFVWKDGAIIELYEENEIK